VKKTLDLAKFELTFEIPPAGVSAIVNGWNMCFAPGRHRVTDPAVAKFLFVYPGVALVAAKPLPPPRPIAAGDPRQFDRCPEESRVVSGFSGGSVGSMKSLKPAPRSKGK
jgi:hypothetical protein